MTQMETMSMNYDDGNIPEIDLPGNARATEMIPDEIPGRNRSVGETANVIPDEMPKHDRSGIGTFGDIPQEVPQHGCPGHNSSHGQEVLL